MLELLREAMKTQDGQMFVLFLVGGGLFFIYVVIDRVCQMLEARKRVSRDAGGKSKEAR